MCAEEKCAQKLAALDLLNRRGNEFGPTDVLQLLPDEWSLAAIAPALMKMTKESTRRVSMLMLVKYFGDGPILLSSHSSKNVRVRY